MQLDFPAARFRLADPHDAMREALDTDAYRTAHAMRGRYMQATSIGIHSAIVERTVTLVREKTAG